MSESALPDLDRELQDLLEVVERAGISTFVSPAAAGVELETAEAFIARMKATEAGAIDLLAARRTSRVRRMALAASSVAAAGVLAVAILGPGGTAPVAQASTPALLEYEFATARDLAYAPGEDPTTTLLQLAAAAAKQKATAGDSQRIVIDEWTASVDDITQDTIVVPQLTERTLHADGSFTLVERREDPLSADGRGIVDASSWSRQPATNTEKLPAGEMDPKRANSLPTDVGALRARLLKESGCPSTGRDTKAAQCLHDEIVSLHRSYVVSPQLNSALWKLLAGEEGFGLLGAVEDRAGREGVGISMIGAFEPEYRWVLIADPETGQLLGTEQILIKKLAGSDLATPAILGFTAIVESRYISK